MSYCVVRFRICKEPIVVPKKYILGDIDSSDRVPFSRYVIFNPYDLDAPVPSQNIICQYRREMEGIKKLEDMEIGMLYPAAIMGVFGN